MADIARVVRVSVALRTSSIRQQTFSDLMLLGSHSGPRLTVIAEADELLDGFGLDQTSGLYRAAQVGFGQDPGPDRLFIGRRDFGETATQALAACADEALGNDWYGVSDVAHDATEAAEIAAWTEANGRYFLTTFGDVGPNAPMRALVTNRYARSGGWYVRPDTDAWPEVAAASKAYQVPPGGESWANMQLAAVPVPPMSETLAQQIFALNGNTYEPIRNLALTQNGKSFSGEYIDNIRFRDWLVEEIRVRVLRVFIDHDKVPYTDAGIAMIVQAMRGALVLGQKRGGIAPDTVDEETRKIRPGFTVSFPRAHQVAENDKALRRLRDVKFSAVLAGAIHNVEVRGELVLSDLNFV